MAEQNSDLSVSLDYHVMHLKQRSDQPPFSLQSKDFPVDALQPMVSEQPLLEMN